MATLPAPLRLTPDARRDLVRTTQRLLEGVYCHLPQKRARYGTDAIVRLQRLLDPTDLPHRGSMADRLFFGEYLAVLHGLRDLHTGLIFTDPRLRGRVAALPLLIERCGPPNKPRYLVTKTTVGQDAPVAKGTVVTHWNGVPIDTAVARLAARTRGANPSAAVARAVEHLTVRPLDEFLQPDEEWVTLTFEGGAVEGGAVESGVAGRARDVRFPWRSFATRDAAGVDGFAAGAIDLGVDHTGRSNQAAKKSLFTSSKAGGFARYEIQTFGRRLVGYLRIYSFVTRDLTAATAELAAALAGFEAASCDGLIVDIRNNPGGIIPLAENLLGLLVDSPVTTRFSFIATPLTQALATSADLTDWGPSVTSAATTGDLFSAPLPITRRERIPAPVTDLPAVLITDATTYSAGDIFAAGWADNHIGPIVATAQTTGAGGANVWTVDQLTSRLPDGFGPYAIPDGLGLRLSVRRALRGGPSDSLPIEDLGITPTVRHLLRPEDLLDGNRSLLKTAVQELPKRRRSLR